MSKFNPNTATTRTTNLAGGRAISMRPEQELIHAVLSTFLEDKYYESGDARIARISSLVVSCSPKFVSNLAIIARKEFNLRSVVTLLISELSKIHRGDSLVKDTIVSACMRVDDLTELVALVGKPLPKQVKRGIRNALLKFNRYQLAKYKAEGKGVSLVDVFNLVHPKAQFATDEQKQAWKDLMEGNLASFDTWETEISNAKDDEDRTQKWEKLIADRKMGYMAILRNLNNFIKYHLSDESIDAVCKILTDPQEVAKSKQLPFRFTTAYENVIGNRKFSNAISEAMDLAVANTPELPGRTLIGIDSSGSMGGDPIKKASIFGATLAKANINADVILYDTKVKEAAFSSRIPVVDFAARIVAEAMGGGTETSLVFQYALQKGIKYDRFIIISDNESWSEGYGRSVQQVYEYYKNQTSTDPFVYAIDIQGYGTKDVTGSKVFHLTGWSNRLLDFVAHAEKGESLVNYVRNYETAHQPVQK